MAYVMIIILLRVSISFYIYLYIYYTNIYLGMTTGYILNEVVMRLRKRPKKTSTNSSITWPIFEGNSRKILPIPTFIDIYNRFMGGIDISNALRATATTHFNRC